MTIDEAAMRNVARAICQSRSCQGLNCCQHPCNGGKHGDWNRFRTKCPVDAGGYDDAAKAAIEAMREMEMVP